MTNPLRSKYIIKSILSVLVIQVFFLALFFGGFLLDPLIGLWVLAMYFFLVSTFFIYSFFLEKFSGVANLEKTDTWFPHVQG